MIKERFTKFKEDVVLKVNAEVTTRKDEITKAITKKAEDYKNKEPGQVTSPSANYANNNASFVGSSTSPIKSTGGHYQRYSMVNLSPSKANQLNNVLSQTKNTSAFG